MGLDGVEPQFARKSCDEDSKQGSCKGDDETGDATFEVTLLHDVTGSGGPLLGSNGGKNNLQTAFGEFVDIEFTPDFSLKEGDLETCFGSGPFEAITMVSQVTPSNTEDAVIRFFFDAKGTDATDATDGTTVNYVLTVLGKFEIGEEQEEPPPWPPTTGNSNTITATRTS